MWCLGLRLDAQAGGGGGGGDRSYLCDGVECIFAFPARARAIGRVDARRFDAAGACVVQAPGDGCHKQQQQRQQVAHVDAAASEQLYPSAVFTF